LINSELKLKQTAESFNQDRGFAGPGIAMIRTLFIIAYTVLATVFWGSIVILASFINKNGRLPHEIARFWAKSILWASGVKVAVIGFSNLNPASPCIYMPNHRSNFDIPVLQAYLAVQFRWLAKAELFRIPLFGQAIKRAGYISIDRSNREAAIESLNTAAKMIKAGMSVLIFPEGTRSHDNTLRPFKKGGFVLALNTGVPIVPVIIHGTGGIMPKKEIQIKPGNVILEIAAPVQTANYSKKTRDDLMEKVRSIMCKSIELQRRKHSTSASGGTITLKWGCREFQKDNKGKALC